MGLGKTLQAITLIWTLLKQSPFKTQTSVAKKVLIVCPATLINNWKKEFNKWLSFRLRVFTVESSTTSIDDFVSGKIQQVMIIGYEKLKKFQNEIQKAGFDLVLCDEGHRIKNGGIQSSIILQSLPTTRRVILSGTPIQNDLGEFYHMVHFVNPNILGTINEFKRNFESCIVTGREPQASIHEREMGQLKMSELLQLTSAFILRRDASINTTYLLPKSEFIIFCRMKEEQLELYRQHCVDSVEAESKNVLTKLIGLRKLANSTSIVGNDASIESIFEASGKFSVLAQMLISIIGLKEKVVIVSHWTQSLDMIRDYLNLKEYSFLRLDGSTPQKSRQTIVDNFNSTPTISCFLLSSKAGGVGLNLIGASRLIMLDIDWNPSIDAQAMARIWRDGQKAHVFIYRLLTTASIEERIFYRQLGKLDLATAVLESKQTVTFSKGEVADLCSVPATDCLVHDLCDCKCGDDDIDHLKPPFTNIKLLEDKVLDSISILPDTSFICKADSFMLS